MSVKAYIDTVLMKKEIVAVKMAKTMDEYNKIKNEDMSIEEIETLYEK